MNTRLLNLAAVAVLVASSQVMAAVSAPQPNQAVDSAVTRNAAMMTEIVGRLQAGEVKSAQDVLALNTLRGVALTPSLSRFLFIGAKEVAAAAKKNGANLSKVDFKGLAEIVEAGQTNYAGVVAVLSSGALEAASVKTALAEKANETMYKLPSNLASATTDEVLLAVRSEDHGMLSEVLQSGNVKQAAVRDLIAQQVLDAKTIAPASCFSRGFSPAVCEAKALELVAVNAKAGYPKFGEGNKNMVRDIMVAFEGKEESPASNEEYMDGGISYNNEVIQTYKGDVSKAPARIQQLHSCFSTGA